MVFGSKKGECAAKEPDEERHQGTPSSASAAPEPVCFFSLVLYIYIYTYTDIINMLKCVENTVKSYSPAIT